MTRLRMMLARVGSLLQTRKLERELETEIQSHIEMHAEENLRNGMDAAEARQAALRSFGGVDQTKERYRELRGVPVIETIVQDVRYGLRALRHNPGFAITTIVSIALAIGANSAVFSFSDALLLRPLPVASPEEVVSLRSVSPSASPVTTGAISYADFVDFRDNLRSFEDLIIYDDIGVGFARNANEQPGFTGGYLVSGDFFRVLGLELQLGRGFTPDEDQVPGRDAVVVLAHDLWKNKFEGSPSVIGRSVRINGLDFTVVGVAPESFTGINQFLKPDFFIPVMMGAKVLGAAAAISDASTLLTSRSERFFQVRGRLKPGISTKAAAREAGTLAASLERSYPATNRGFGATVYTEVQDRLATFQLGPFVTAMFVIVIVILLIACANVANLLLSRGRDRSREIAVRLAVGASRFRLVRLLLVESLLIAFAGGVLAWFTADFALRIFSAMVPPSEIPFYLGVRLDGRVLRFTILVSAASALLFGLVPALQAARTDLVSTLKAGETDQGRKRFFGRNALVIVQIAGSMLLLVGATQFRRAFDDALVAYPGFLKDHRITMRFDPGIANYPPARTQQFYEGLVERSLQVPGVKSAALTSFLPMTYMDMGLHTVIPEGFQSAPGRERVDLLSYVVDHHYFETLGVKIVAGRSFQATDSADSPRVAIVNEAFAKEYLGPNPVGKRVWLGDRSGPLVEIVGVTVTGKTVSVIEPTVEVLYLPYSQNPMPRMTLIAETSGDPALLAGPLLEMVRSTDPNIPVFWVRTMEDVFETSLVAGLRLTGTIYNCASLIGLVLALVGLYAVVSYQVAQKTREIGIRMALGAKRIQVTQVFLKRAAAMGITGVGIGLALSMVAGQALATGLAAPPFNKVLLGFVTVGMLLTTILAAAIPARRASRIDPQRALRQE